MKKVLVAAAALAALASAGFGAGIGVNWTAGGRVYGLDGERGIAADGAVVWQLVCAGPNGVADHVDRKAADWVGGDDVLLAVRFVPAGGGVASDGTEWTECLEKLGGDCVYEDVGWWSEDGCFVYQRIYQDESGANMPSDVYYQSGLFSVRMTYDGWGPTAFPDMFGAAAGAPDGAVSASLHEEPPPPLVPEDWIGWGPCEWNWQTVGGTNQISIISQYPGAYCHVSHISLAVLPDDGTFGFAGGITGLDAEDFVRGADGYMASIGLVLLKEPEKGSTYVFTATPRDASMAIEHELTVGQWQYTLADGQATVKGAVSVQGNLVVPQEVDGYPVTGIASNAFANSADLTSVTIPDGVTHIGGGAFSYCDNLTNVVLPRGLGEIEARLFCWCRGLVTAAIPDGVGSIGNFAFYNCRALSAVTLPEGTASIGDYAFVDCDKLLEITIPDSVTRIGERAFAYCNMLTNLVVGNGVAGIGTNAFLGCNALQTLHVPASWEGTSMLDDAGVPAGCTVVYRAMPGQEVTTTGVPHDWLEENAAGILAESGSDYEAAAKAPAANGRPVWECYVAGLDPADAGAAFRAELSCEDGTWKAKPVGGEKAGRAYRVEGKRELADDGWTDVTDVEDVEAEGWRFFRVGVGMAE